MTVREKPQAAPPIADVERGDFLLDLYARVISGLMMLFGFRQWAVILGIIGGVGGPFEAMDSAWQVATMHFAVVDLVAAVGLWMRSPWGIVVWIYAALSEIALHTIFSDTYGFDVLVVAFHLITIGGFLVLLFLYRNRAPR